MHFLHGFAKGNDPAHIQRLPCLLKNHPLLCIIVQLFPLRKFCDSLQCLWKWPTLSNVQQLSCLLDVCSQWNGSHPAHFQQLSCLFNDYPLLCIILLLPQQKFCHIFQCWYHAWKHKWTYNFRWRCSIVRWSGWFLSGNHSMYILWATISSRIHILEMHVGKLWICVTIQVAWNPCGEWRFKPAKHFHPRNLTAPSTASTLHFAHIG